MAGMMKAFVMKRIGEVGVMGKPIPEPGPNDAVVKTAAALVCTSDVHTVKGAIGERTDMTLGHEACGIVYKLGKRGHRIQRRGQGCGECHNSLLHLP